MELFISFNNLELEQALAIGNRVQNYADAFRIGTVLITHYGTSAIAAFRKQFPRKTLICDIKIADHEQELVKLTTQVGADWITVLADTNPSIIRIACMHAHAAGAKVMLDMVGASSGQRALEANSLGVDALLFHRIANGEINDTFLDRWDMVRGNTKLPVYISTALNRENIGEMLKLDPTGIILGGAITEAPDPEQEANYFFKLVRS